MGILTLYALFGDDMRLCLTERPADAIFDSVTLACMFFFCTEILVCSIGQGGYLLGFFFFLDIISTLTLVLDITYVAEWLFGDSVSQNSDAQQSSGGGETGDNSAEAARAARMSRAGTKAGRVVRLIRLMRLIRLVKVLKKRSDKQADVLREAAPGISQIWDDDDMAVNRNESAVSKKLSEMTTRRVVILVLSILLMLPFFEASMYKDALNTSSQYGIDSLYRRFRDDMTKFEPTTGQVQKAAYLNSLARDNYVNDFLLTIYFHNWFCEGSPIADKDASPDSSFGKLFFLGGSPTDAAEAEFFLPGSASGPPVDWNKAWSGKQWESYLCDLPPKAQAALRTPWHETRRCLNGQIRGVSIIESEDSRAKCPEDLRYQERIVVSPLVMSKAEAHKFVFIAVFDRRSGSRMEAALNSVQTIFICMLLGFGAMTFSKDANQLVLAPIERMITKLDKIRANPIAAMSLGEEIDHLEVFEAMRRGSLNQATADFAGKHFRHGYGWCCKKLRCGRVPKKQAAEPMETIVLEKTMIKIGSLLALGFGEAGAEVIAQNMAGSNLMVNAKTGGKKVDAIFGLCSIRDFTDVIDVLENHIMVFVNRLASIVHSIANEFFGSPNQNNGGTFLLVWRLSSHEEAKQCRLADCAAVCITKVIAHLSKSKVLEEYRGHPCLAKRLPNYRVCMGFGLHTGWAIEGAIGSDFKIDASYIGPHVCMAARFQGFTHVYGTKVIIGDQMVKLMSKPIAALCRLIDCVALPDWDPIRLYTIDLDDMALEVEDPRGNQSVYNGVFAAQRDQFKQRIQRQRKRIERWSDDFDMGSYVKDEPDIQTMRGQYLEEFFSKFSNAFTNYVNGDWAKAALELEQTRFFNMVEDGPSAALLDFIRMYNDKAPPEWKGYHVVAHDHQPSAVDDG